MDLAIKSGNKKILEAAFDSVGTVLDVVKKLEGGSGKLTKKYGLRNNNVRPRKYVYFFLELLE